MEIEIIFSRIRKTIIDAMGLSADEVKMNSHFINDLGVDSLMLAELIMLLEDEFKIRIPDEDAIKINTVEDAVNYIQSVV